MKIAIDARMSGLDQRGIGRVVSQLMKQFDKKVIADEVKIDFLLTSKNIADINFSTPNCRKVEAEYSWYGLQEQLGFLKFLASKNYDLVLFMNFNHPLLYFKRHIVFIHDLLMLTSKNDEATTRSRLVYKLKKFFLKLIIWKAVKFSHSILVPSQAVKNELLDRYGHKYEQKITVVYPGIDWDSELNFDDSILQKHSLSKYLMYVGAYYPHKNVSMLVKAFKRFRQNYPEYKLVLAGKIDNFAEKIKQHMGPDGEEGVVFTGFVSDAELNSLLKHTDAYVNPSVSEGFNLTPMEALRAGASKIVVSSIPVNIEIYTDIAQIFDFNNDLEVAQSLIEVMENSTPTPNVDKESARKYSSAAMADAVFYKILGAVEKI